jgi:two-component sensor histidine kinase
VPDCEVFVSAVEGIRIATDTAIPIALLVNELILNSAKHAYPGRSCQGWVTLTRPAGRVATAGRNRARLALVGHDQDR